MSVNYYVHVFPQHVEHDILIDVANNQVENWVFCLPHLFSSCQFADEFLFSTARQIGFHSAGLS